MAMKLAILESPFRGDTEKNMAYARQALRDALTHGYAPIASHLLYTQVLDDNSPEERRIGIDAGHEWMASAEVMLVYTDLGISSGMQEGIDYAKAIGLPIAFIKLG